MYLGSLTPFLLPVLGQATTSLARTLTVFLVGRAITGVGGSAVMVVPFILVLELVSKRRRGIFMGLVNAGFTTGVSLGAVVYGALINNPGWVRVLPSYHSLSLSLSLFPSV